MHEAHRSRIRFSGVQAVFLQVAVYIELEIVNLIGVVLSDSDWLEVEPPIRNTEHRFFQLPSFLPACTPQTAAIHQRIFIDRVEDLVFDNRLIVLDKRYQR